MKDKMFLRYIDILKITTLFLFFSVLWNIQAQSESQENAKAEHDPTHDRLVAKVVAKLIQDHHYTRQKCDDNVSELLFEEYFSLLDPSRYFFLQSDLDEFSSYRKILDDLIITGNIDFAFRVYQRLLNRIEERVKYVKKIVHMPFDFDKDEFFRVDRREAPWAKNKTEIDDIWRKRIKNQLLIDEFSKEDEEGEENKKEDDKVVISPQERLIKRYENYYGYFTDNDHSDILEFYLTALLHTYDPHSSYLNWRSIEDFDIHMSLSLQGIGATLTTEDGYTKIVNLVPGGPADRDGRLQPGDRIISVAQGGGIPVDIVDMPLKKVVRRIRGPMGTEVRLTVIKSLNSPPMIINLIRDQVKLTDEEAKSSVKPLPTKDGLFLRAGVIDLPSFYADFESIRAGNPAAKATSKDVRKLIDSMIANDRIKGLIIDLRSNGGGSLDEAINLTGLFIQEGPTVQIRTQRGIQVRKDHDDGFYYDLPLVVIVNRSSASASEIFAGAIKDYKRGVIVGDLHTHGKGTVQTILKLDRLNGFRGKKVGAMKYTMAKFYRVTGASTQKRGVVPDIILPSFFDGIESGEAYLKHALPWDDISSQKILQPINISNLLPEVILRSANRVREDIKFQQLKNEVKRYKKRNEEKMLTLNKGKRIAMRKEDEYWAKKSKAILGVNDEKTQDSQSDKLPQEEITDIYLEESLRVLADIIELSEERKLAKDDTK